MMEIKMQSRIYEVVEVKKKTKAAMFKNLKTGNEDSPTYDFFITKNA